MTDEKKDVWGAAKMAEFAEEQKVTNVLLRDLIRELHGVKSDLRSLGGEVRELRARFDVHRDEAYRRHQEHEARLRSLEDDER